MSVFKKSNFFYRYFIIILIIICCFKYIVSHPYFLKRIIANFLKRILSVSYIFGSSQTPLSHKALKWDLNSYVQFCVSYMHGLYLKKSKKKQQSLRDIRYKIHCYLNETLRKMQFISKYISNNIQVQFCLIHSKNSQKFRKKLKAFKGFTPRLLNIFWVSKRPSIPPPPPKKNPASLNALPLSQTALDNGLRQRYIYFMRQIFSSNPLPLKKTPGLRLYFQIRF